MRARYEELRLSAASRPLNAMLYKVQSPSALLVGVGDGGKEMLLPVEPDTKIFIQGEPAKISDLQPDMLLSIQQEAGITRTIQARLPRRVGARDGERNARPVVRDGDAANKQAKEGQRDRQVRPREGEQEKQPIIRERDAGRPGTQRS